MMDAMGTGLCDICAHAECVTSSRQSTFSLCRLSLGNSRYAKYPALPVLNCEGYEPRSIRQATNQPD
jgi:hypothetical protein